MHSQELEPRRKSSFRSLWSCIVVSGFGALIAALLFFLVILPMLSPTASGPVNQEQAYLSVGSADLDPTRDHLIETRDKSIAIYVPQGAFHGSGSLFLLPRETELIPEREEGGFERTRAVDVVIIDAEGELLSSVNFTNATLLCFRVTEQQHSQWLEDPKSVSIQRYGEVNGRSGWIELPLSPGWEQYQICSAVDHLSVFALAFRRSLILHTPEPYPDLELTPPGIYDLPEQAP